VKTGVAPDKMFGHMEQQYRLVVVLDLKLGNADGLDILRISRGLNEHKSSVGKRSQHHAGVVEPLRDEHLISRLLLNQPTVRKL
jgi:hypothetical protein